MYKINASVQSNYGIEERSKVKMQVAECFGTFREQPVRSHNLLTVMSKSM